MLSDWCVRFLNILPTVLVGFFRKCLVYFLKRDLETHRTGVAKLFDPRAEFATAWPVEGRILCDLRNLCKNRLLKCFVVQY